MNPGEIYWADLAASRRPVVIISALDLTTWILGVLNALKMRDLIRAMGYVNCAEREPE